MNAPPCPERLLACAEMVPHGHTVADVGCDHGQLAVWLVHHDQVPQVIAIDRAPAPLERARRHVAVWDLADRVEMRLGDGLEPLATTDRVRTVVMAGMGGDAMVRILDPERVTALGLRCVIVQANRRIDRIEDALATMGFERWERRAGPASRWPWSVAAWHLS